MTDSIDSTPSQQEIKGMDSNKTFWEYDSLYRKYMQTQGHCIGYNQYKIQVKIDLYLALLANILGVSDEFIIEHKDNPNVQRARSLVQRDPFKGEASFAAIRDICAPLLHKLQKFEATMDEWDLLPDAENPYWNSTKNKSIKVGCT